MTIWIFYGYFLAVHWGISYTHSSFPLLGQPPFCKKGERVASLRGCDGKVVFAPQNKQILWFCLTFPSFEHKLHSTVQLKMCKNSVKTVLHTLYSFKILNAEVQHFEIVSTFWNCVKILKLCEHFEIMSKLLNSVKSLKLSPKKLNNLKILNMGQHLEIRLKLWK